MGAGSPKQPGGGKTTGHRLPRSTGQQSVMPAPNSTGRPSRSVESTLPIGLTQRSNLIHPLPGATPTKPAPGSMRAGWAQARSSNKITKNPAPTRWGRSSKINGVDSSIRTDSPPTNLAIETAGGRPSRLIHPKQTMGRRSVSIEPAPP